MSVVNVSTLADESLFPPQFLAHKIQISETTKDLLDTYKEYNTSLRGVSEVKHQTVLTTYWLDRKRKGWVGAGPSCDVCVYSIVSMCCNCSKINVSVGVSNCVSVSVS